MADIIIKGMEMPKDCVHCSLLEGSTDDGLCHAANKWMDDEYFRWYQYPEGDFDDSKPLNCPLVPLPKGHGRLGDLDALQEEFKKSHNGKRLMLIDTAPTIVPAEGGTDECSEN